MTDDQTSDLERENREEVTVNPSSSADGGQVLQLSLHGDALSKFATILHEQGLQTVEEAIDYFYSLHIQQAPKKLPGRRGRPKGSKNKRPSLADCTQPDDGVAAHTDSDGNVGTTSFCTSLDVPAGEQIVGDAASYASASEASLSQRRRSSRQRRNPFAGTDFVALPTLDESSGEGEEDDKDTDAAGNAARATSRSSGGITADEDESWIPAEADTADGNEDDETMTPSAESGDDAVRGSGRARYSRVRTKVRGRCGRPRKRPFTEDELTSEERSTRTCCDCSANFAEVAELLLHKLEHVGKNERLFRCGLCEYTASFKCDIERHHRKHRMDKAYKCAICRFSTNWERNLAIHMSKVHEGRHPWKCEICGELVHNPTKIKQHQLSHRENVYRCTVCGLLFDKERQLQLHANIHTSSRPHTCRLCGYATTYRSNLLNHVRFKHQKVKRGNVPKKSYRCPICSRTFKTEEHLQTHGQVHDPSNRNDEKPFYCTDCSFRAADVNQIVRHRLVHGLEKPHKCSQCDYSTRWRKDLRTHEMIHTGVKTVRCPQCEYACYTVQRLKVHMLRHDATKRFACDLCSSCFKTRQVLRLHRMYHTGDSMFTCDDCGFKTITEARLRKHKQKHTDDRNFACDVCGKRFKQPHHVSQHRDIVHLGKPSYREKRRIALQQDAVQVLEGLAAVAAGEASCCETSMLISSQYGSIAFTGTHDPDESAATAAPSVQEENTHYVMVETSQGYQYVAVVLPDNETHSINDEQQQHIDGSVSTDRVAHCEGNEGEGVVALHHSSLFHERLMQHTEITPGFEYCCSTTTLAVKESPVAAASDPTVQQ